MFEIIAQATQPTPPPPIVQFLQGPMFILLVGILLMYTLVFRAKSKENRARQNMLSALKKGDRVQTIGGVLGTVVEARDGEVLLKVDESSNTKIRFTRSAIHRVIADDASGDK